MSGDIISDVAAQSSCSRIRMKKISSPGYPKCAQWRFRWDCANAQTDRILRWAHMSEGKFSDVAVSLDLISSYVNVCPTYVHIRPNKTSWSIQDHVIHVYNMSRDTAFPTRLLRRLAKTQISVRIRAVWSESSMSTWRRFGSLTSHYMSCEDSDQTAEMRRLLRLRCAHIPYCSKCWAPAHMQSVVW